MTPQSLKRAIANLIDDFCILNKRVEELREHNAYLESRISESEDVAALRARVARLEEAITPSADTKAAYMGEFSMRIPEVDDNGEEYMRPLHIPWIVIKDIMKAIAARAEVDRLIANETAADCKGEG